MRSAFKLSARRQSDLEYIAALPTITGAGIVIIDDFHRLPDAMKGALADYLKILADEGKEGTKLSSSVSTALANALCSSRQTWETDWN
jgi:hypothetical protein